MPCQNSSFIRRSPAITKNLNELVIYDVPSPKPCIKKVKACLDLVKLNAQATAGYGESELRLVGQIVEPVCIEDDAMIFITVKKGKKAPA